jgi:hypothetical protein
MRELVKLGLLRSALHPEGDRYADIALAAQPGPNFPRLRALALFGRLSAQRV